MQTIDAILCHDMVMPMQLKTFLDKIRKNTKAQADKAHAITHNLCAATKAKFKKWATKKTDVASSATTEKREDLFFKIIGYGSIVASIVVAFCWGEDPKGSTQPLADAGISQVTMNGFNRDAKSCHFAIEPYRTKFNGTAKDGTAVSGTVCKNLLGQKRIAFDKA